MGALHIRDIPPEVLDALKRRAARNERSLQGELRYILRKIAEAEPVAPPRPLELHLATDARGKTSWSREEIYGSDAR